MDGVQAFGEAAARPGRAGVEDGALLISAFGALASSCGGRMPAMEQLSELAERGRAELDVLASQVRVESAGDSPRLEDLLGHLFGVCKYMGNFDDYYDPANSLLLDVFARRRGNPITLSVLTMAVGRRVGVNLDGVGMPGHFLLRTEGTPTKWIDAYHGGVVIAPEDLEAEFKRLTGGRLPFHSSYAEAVTPTQILARMLANLQVIYSERREPHQLAWVAWLSTTLPATRPGAVKAIAERVAELGQFDLAGGLLDFARERSAGTDRLEFDAESKRMWGRLN